MVSIVPSTTLFRSTSTDVVDTANGYRLKQANQLIYKGMDRLLEAVASKAKEHKLTLMMGRTHGVHAEPTTFGLKCALWYAELKRNVARFRQARSEEHTSELQSRGHLVCRLLLEK